MTRMAMTIHAVKIEFEIEMSFQIVMGPSGEIASCPENVNIGVPVWSATWISASPGG